MRSPLPMDLRLVSDIDLIQLRARIDGPGKVYALIEAAACVANALHIGVGGFISGTLMEQELRDALCLGDEEMVNIPKHSSASAPQEKT